MDVKLLSFNMSTATSAVKLAAMYEIIKEANADVVLLQEVRAPTIGCPG